MLIHRHHFDRLLLLVRLESLLVAVLRRFKKITTTHPVRMIRDVVVMNAFRLAGFLNNTTTSGFVITLSVEIGVVVSLGVICLLVKLHFLLIESLLAGVTI